MYKKSLLLTSLLMLSSGNFAHAQTNQPETKFSEPNIQNIITLNAVGQTEVQQDYLSLILGTSIQGTDANQVQEQLTKTINKALTQAKGVVEANKGKKDAISVKTSVFAVTPKYDKQHIVGWNGIASITLEGKDFNLITQTASEIPDLTVKNIQFSLSDEATEKVRKETTEKAINNFKANSADLTKQFGFNTYQIKEVNVMFNLNGFIPRNVPMMAMAKSSMDMANESIQVESSKVNVEATVSGSILVSK